MKGEGDLHQEGRGYNRSQGGKRNKRYRRGKEVQEQGEENKAEELNISVEEGEEYMSEGEDERPCIKWKSKKTRRES